MESKLFVFLLLLVVSCAAGQDSSDSSSVSSDSSESSSSESSSSESSSNDSDRTYPCSLDDWDCIQNYFVSTNLCTSANHEDEDPINRESQVTYLPKWNVTLYTLNDVITFFNSSIETFYVNKQTNNLVMTVNFDAINCKSPNAKFIFHLRGQEPMFVEDYVDVTYSAAITAIIPSAGQRGIIGTSVSSFNTNALPPFDIGPKITDSSDEVVNDFFEGLISDIPTAVQELFLTKAPYFFFTYLQEYICNYGLIFTGEIAY